MKKLPNQLTLQELIDRLRELPSDTYVNLGTEFCSYRGYYQDLAIAGGTSTAGYLVELLEQNALHEFVTGYKGGSFDIGPNTPVWCSSGGTATGLAIVGVSNDGIVQLEKEEVF